MKQKITLGQAFAYLHYRKKNKIPIMDLDREEIAYINSLAERAKNANHSFKDAIMNFSAKNKDENKYTDFFISMFLNKNTNETDMDLIKFLNNNMDCFEEYSIVFNDFTQKLAELKLS